MAKHHPRTNEESRSLLSEARFAIAHIAASAGITASVVFMTTKLFGF